MSRSRQRFTHTDLYTRDVFLFEQRMQYTLDGISWWATPCCYCGDPFEAQDHVFPVSALSKLGSVGRTFLPRDVLRIVPSCHECNSIAGDKVFHTFEAKRAHIKWRLAQKYSRVVEAPEWEPEEIEALRGRMHDWIAHGQELRDAIFERLRF